MSATKTVIVTGGGGGIGLECAKALAGTGDWHVVATTREPGRVAASRSDGGDITTMPLNLASLSSVRAFVEGFAARPLPPLHALVCNAGTMALKGVTYTQDGFEENFGVNHLGHFLLANLLLPHLRPLGRVVFVSSMGHDPKSMAGRSHPPRYLGAARLARPTPDEIRTTTGLSRYGTSKLCNVLCAYELSRRAPTVRVNAYEPGVVLGTRLGRDLGRVNRFLASQAWLLRLMGAKVRSAADAGAALARLVTDPALTEVTGRYFDGVEQARSSAESYGEQKAAELWEASAQLVGLPVVHAEPGAAADTRRRNGSP